MPDLHFISKERVLAIVVDEVVAVAGTTGLAVRVAIFFFATGDVAGVVVVTDGKGLERDGGLADAGTGGDGTFANCGCVADNALDVLVDTGASVKSQYGHFRLMLHHFVKSS
jgi:hypothetical protein